MASSITTHLNETMRYQDASIAAAAAAAAAANRDDSKAGHKL
jgi:hypothetical protein